MRQKHETTTSFNQLQEITQAMQALKKSALKNATNQESERTQASANAKAHTQERTQASENTHASESAHQLALNPKATTQAKKGALKPTKKAFSERQNTAFRDNSQAIAKTSFKTKASHNANAFKTEQANNNFKPGLAKHQNNQKGGQE
ncbi:hypothetical protein [Helicobacter pylori]|uniref:hypothetical protein n=1 Tax=Helicobacter pylori TaxID=210 RepID=UPI00165C3D2C|nr:hypothetical protein [Helicobacter pylori]